MANQNPPVRLTAGQIATLVCQLEVAAAKPGNVHRGADFEDVTLIDFLNSGVALGAAIDARELTSKNSTELAASDVERPVAGEQKLRTPALGELVWAAVKATAWVTDTNTNLGIVLLLCPLALLHQRNQVLSGDNVGRLIATTDAKDTKLIYQSIAQSCAGGLELPIDRCFEEMPKQFDVLEKTSVPESLVAAMALAADRDMIARQYSNGLADVFDFVLPAIEEGYCRLNSLTSAIIYAHVKTMAHFPDSLIARKLGTQAALQSAGHAQRAVDVWATCEGDFQPFWNAVADLDFWLRSDRHRRNPGTTADLITAALYVGVSQGRFVPPFR